MKIFNCQNCQQVLYFENTHCERCGHAVGYAEDRETILTLKPTDKGLWRPVLPNLADQLYRSCGNAAQKVCNWIVPAQKPDALCSACQLNQVIPDLSVPENVLRWSRLELAKHHLVYSLRRLQLPIVSKVADPKSGLAFSFVADTGVVDPCASAPASTTGHCEGLITINLGEADDTERERRRTSLGEPYRTLLGHFRHEVGHYYWERLLEDGGKQLDECRRVFGDDRQSYSESLAKHYAAGPTANWQHHFVSSYASAHPFEDFAETWAHYLHIVDTLDTAHAFGLAVRPDGVQDTNLAMIADFDPYAERNFARLMKPWLPLTLAVNSLNRSMGQPDLYPFVLGPTVNTKLDFVHRLIHARQGVSERAAIVPDKGGKSWTRWLRRSPASGAEASH